MADAYPLCWPDGFPRTSPLQRTWGAFGTTPDKAARHLREEVRRLGGSDLIISSNVPVRRDGLPYANATEPSDPGVAIYFEWEGHDRAMACDRYNRVWKNVRALGLCIEALRSLDRHGSSAILDRAFRGFTALPSGIILARPWPEVLGVPRGSSEEEVRAAYLRASLAAHPDKGGTDEQMAEVNRAVEDALRELSVGGGVA